MTMNMSNIPILMVIKMDKDDDDKQEPEADEKGFEETGEEASKKAKVDANATCEGS